LSFVCMGCLPSIESSVQQFSQEFNKGGTNQGRWGTEVPSGVQGQNMETVENTNGAVTKIDLQ